MTLQTPNAMIRLSSLAPALNNVAEKAPPSRLEEKLEEMRKLKTDQELGAWQIGRLVKEIIDERLWEDDPSCRNAEDCFRKKFKEIGTRITLYRYKAIAERFSENDVRQFRIDRLRALLVHETHTGERLPEGNPGDHEIRLLQKDGSELVKPFKDCSANEVTRSNNRRAKSLQAQVNKVANAKPGILRKVVLAGIGIAMLVVADLIPDSWLSMVSTLVGGTLLIAGGTPLVRRGYKWLVSLIRSGQAIELLATMPSKLLALSRSAAKGAHSFWSLVRSGQIVHALAKLPSKVSSLVKQGVAGLKRLASKLLKRSPAAPSSKDQDQPPLTGGLAPPSAS